LRTQKDVLARALFPGCTVCKQFSFGDMLIKFPYSFALLFFLHPSQLNGKTFHFSMKLLLFLKLSPAFYWASGFDTTKGYYSKALIKPDSNISFLMLLI